MLEFNIYVFLGKKVNLYYLIKKCFNEDNLKSIYQFLLDAEKSFEPLLIVIDKFYHGPVGIVIYYLM